jgi:hypothetical protein
MDVLDGRGDTVAGLGCTADEAVLVWAGGVDAMRFVLRPHI